MNLVCCSQKHEHNFAVICQPPSWAGANTTPVGCIVLCVGSKLIRSELTYQLFLCQSSRRPPLIFDRFSHEYRTPCSANSSLGRGRKASRRINASSRAKPLTAASPGEGFPRPTGRNSVKRRPPKNDPLGGRASNLCPVATLATGGISSEASRTCRNRAGYFTLR